MKLVGHIALPWFDRSSICPSIQPAHFFCACHVLRNLHARVSKFYIWFPHEKLGDPCFFFLVRPVCTFRVMPL